MKRRIFQYVTSPAMLLGLVLVIACTVSVVAINLLQNRLIERINDKVASRHAAHEMEVAVHSMRFHFLTSLINPTKENRELIKADHFQFEDAFLEAKQLAPPEQEALLRKIQDRYQRYRAELSVDQKKTKPSSREELLKWIEEHPIQQVVAPCEELLEANRKLVQQSFEESRQSSWRIQAVLFVLAVVGPVGGLFSGYFMARSLSRSIARLKVRVQDVHSQVAPEEGVVDLQMGEDLDGLHDGLDIVVQRVQVLVERLQQHQREQARAERLAVAGQMASSVAHEIRNPLTAMKWLVDHALQSYPDEPISLQDLRVLKGEIERMRQSVQDMLDFARPSLSVRTRGDLRSVVRQTLELIRVRKGQLGVLSEYDLPPNPIWAEFDATQIKSVLVNLLLNALDAMPVSGVLRVHLDQPTPSEVRLVVEDTGHGIPPDILPIIFTPFVSTKESGTGLGLAVTKRVIEEHCGTIVAMNRREGGARFVITLPALPTPIKEMEMSHANKAEAVDHR